MNSQALEVFFWALVAVAIYAVLARGAFRATEPLREQMLEMAAEVCNDSRTTEIVKHRICSALDDVHSTRSAWKLTAFAFGLLLFYPARWVHRNRVTAEDRLPTDLRKKVQNIQVRWAVATVANSPAALLIFSVLLLFLTALTMSVRSISERLMAQNNHHDHAHAS